jgi:hypothetical protein
LAPQNALLRSPGASAAEGACDANTDADCEAKVGNASTSRRSSRRRRSGGVIAVQGGSKPRASKKVAASERPARGRSSRKLRRAGIT